MVQYCVLMKCNYNVSRDFYFHIWSHKLVKIKKKTTNMWKYKVGNKANMANFVCSWKTRNAFHGRLCSQRNKVKYLSFLVIFFRDWCGHNKYFPKWNFVIKNRAKILFTHFLSKIALKNCVCVNTCIFMWLTMQAITRTIITLTTRRVFAESAPRQIIIWNILFFKSILGCDITLPGHISTVKCKSYEQRWWQC